MKIFYFFLFSLCLQVATAQPLQRVAPEQVGMDSRKLMYADEAIETAIADKDIPGAVLAVVRNGKMAYLKAYGNKRVCPNAEPMTTNTIFDMASCSKSMSTAVCVMILAERGKLRMLDPVSLYIPNFKNWESEDGKEKKIVFSGDIGNLNQPLIKDPVYLHDADYVVMESTYGDRSHGDRPDYVGLLSEVIQRTFDRGGSVIIPSFAVGRTQEMLYFIRQIKEEGRVHGHDNFKVYVDSPLANEATTIFNEHIYDCFDEEALALVNKGINPLMFPGLKTSITSDDSKAINFDEDCKVIISASGMCDAGRIKHHLKHNLWNPNNTILFVGYQAIGTLGRSLLEGATEVKLFGETVYVGAEICQMPGISGHADVNGLMTWIKSFSQKPTKVFVTHGDDEVTEIFARRLEEELGLDAMAPFSGTVFDLAENVCIYEAQGIKITKAAVSPKTSKAARAFQKLVAMGQRLMSVIRKSEGIPNKDLDRFTREVQSLCDKWDRDDLS